MIVKERDKFKIYSGWCKGCGAFCKEVTIYMGHGKDGGGEPLRVSDCCESEIEYETERKDEND